MEIHDGGRPPRWQAMCATATSQPSRQDASTVNPARTELEERPIVRSVLYLTPRNGDAAAVVDYYRHAGVLERARRQDGCLGAALYVPSGGSGPILVTALWRDEKAYEGWLANPSRKADAGELDRLVEDDIQAGVRGAVYEVVIAVGADEP
jgi:quinol monooxygenase YgiN